ncbi:MAG: M1 family aminopeptidase [Ignavibacteria bacterium]
MFGQEPTERKSNYDVQHVAIGIGIHFENNEISGVVTTTLLPLEENFHEFELDAVGMKIYGVWLNQILNLKYEYNGSKIKIFLDKNYSKKDTLKFSIGYNVTNPEKGLYFIHPTPEFPNKRFEVWSQGEGEDNRYWFPCYDYPNDKATTEIIIHVDSKFQTISNGVLVDKTNNHDLTTTWHWVNDKPHSSYLVMLAVGNWDTISTSWNGIPIISYVPPGQRKWGENSYRQTADIVKFFSEYSGYRYAWKELRQVAVQDFIYGGMENTGAIVYYDGSVYDEKTEPDYNSTSLIAHEIAHQWWGDVLTCKNWNEIWLNESFATYFQCLYFEHLYGKDDFDYEIYKNSNSSIRVDSSNRKPIYIREGPTTNTYDKGSVVLNMLRYIVGDEKFRKTMNIYITENQFKPVTTKDLSVALHKAMDNPLLDQMPANLDWFFDEWIYKAGQPEIKADYTYDENTKEITLNAVQVQRMDSSSVFKTPFNIEIITEKSKQYISMETSDLMKSYKIKLDSKPSCVIFNKGNKVLSKLYFTKPKSDWLYQLNNSIDAVDRMTALAGLKDFINDDDVVSAVLDKMKNDSFWGMRYEAVKMIANSTNRSVQDVYLRYLVEENDSRVRRVYLSSLGTLFKNNPELKENAAVTQFFLDNLIRNETSYYCRAEGISALASILDSTLIYDAVIPFIGMDSHADIIRRNVLSSLEKSKDPRAKDVFLKYGETGSTSRVRNIAISALGDFLSETGVIEYLNDHLLNQPRSTQGVILNLLERAKSPSSKPVLGKLLENSNDDKFKERITKVIQAID